MNQDEEIERKRNDLFLLLEACPFSHDNQEDCPLHKVRELDNDLRLQWFKNLSQDDIDYLSRYHHVCYCMNKMTRH